MRLAAFAFIVALITTPVYAEVKTKVIEYKQGDTTLQGFLAWDDAVVSEDGAKKAPGVLIIHQWMGLTDYEQMRAKQIAALGYVAFAADIYGKGVRPENTATAAKTAGGFKNDRALYRARLQAGLTQLKSQPFVDANMTAAIGYCFGGTGVLELARSGADVNGVVSFHGGLDSPTPDDGKSIKAKVLVCHGADDPFVPAADIEAFKAELNSAGVDWQMIYYSDAVHSFTQKMAGNDKSAGAAYNEKADMRSWQAMRDFFAEIFAD